jgi:hypothetical protein
VEEKVRLLPTLAGLAIGFAVPILAQEENAIDPEVRQQIEALIVELDEAYNRSDAAAIEALFTPDAVQVGEWESAGGMASGQQAIESWRQVPELAKTEMAEAVEAGYVDGIRAERECQLAIDRGRWTGCV